MYTQFKISELEQIKMLLAKLNNNYKRSLKESEKIPSSNCNALTDQELTLQKKNNVKRILKNL